MEVIGLRANRALERCSNLLHLGCPIADHNMVGVSGDCWAEIVRYNDANKYKGA